MYNKRLDGRKADELRTIKARVGIVKRADGSAMFQIGKTIALAAVYGPRQLHPKFLQNPKMGLLRCNYNMMSFSGSGERVRPGTSRRSKEISYVTEGALAPVLDLEEYPNTVVDVFIEILQSDSGTRCAGICAASMALADAGLKMKDLVSAVAVGRIDGKLVVDLTKEEEDYDGEVADIAIAITPRTGEITLLQMDGFANKEELAKSFENAKEACKKIWEVQKKALKEKYT
ncbi:exosome complex exonuclease Rrp41 [Candidatus Woesearchaeota archaeon]|nr:exosome complex exonuclease Rrp41 [Candidatus Woesearchaeota archaeon]